MAMEVISFSAGSHGLRMLTCGRSKPFLRPIHHLPLSRSPFYRFASSRLHHRPIVGSFEKNHDSHHHDDDHDDHGHNHHHPHHHHHHHHHSHASSGKLNALQEAIIQFARVTGWARLAGFLRENIWMCCSSMALLIFAAACPHVLPSSFTKQLQNVLLAAAFPLVGISAALDAANDVAGGKVNIHVLMTLAAFASVFMGNSLEGGLLLAMFNLAHIAEDYFTSRAMVDVKELKDNNPEFALLLDVKNGNPSDSSLTYKQVPVQKLEVGSYILVRAGEAVPVDGEIYQGRSTVTVEHLTGEPKPLEKKTGDCIPGGARNLDGMLIVKVAKTWKESTLERIVQLTQEAHLNKPKLQRWLDEFGERYSQAVVALSLAIAFIGPFVFGWPFFSTSVCRGSVYRSLGLMVAASPCALAVSPLAYATAISACARKGILLKGGHVLDALASCHTVAFDKTGTLTTGELTCKAIEPIHGHSSMVDEAAEPSCCVPNCEKEALAVAAAMEKGTTHPIGRAVVDHSVGKDLPHVSVESFESLPGRGLFATLTCLKSDDKDRGLLKASLGSVEYITSLCKTESESNKIKDAVSASVYGEDFVHAALSVNRKVTLFHFEDKPRPRVEKVVAALRNQARLRLMMLTGDHASSAWRVADSVGIDEVYSSLKPEDKLNRVKTFSRDTDGGLIMVGDGINDAPALAAATVGIVLAQRASATAVAVADVLLLQDNIAGVPFVIAKARQTTLLVKQSVVLALSCIILASLPSVLGFLPLWLTVLLHEGGTLLVCLNSVRALNAPTWSWRHDLQLMLDGLKDFVAGLLEVSPASASVGTAAL